MKKSFWSIIGIAAISCMVSGIVQANLTISEVFDTDGVPSDDAYTRILNDYDHSRGYSSSITPSCDVISGAISVSSPILQDSYFDNAAVYRLFISPYRISQLKNGGDDIDISKVIVKKFDKPTGDDGQITINISPDIDHLDSNQVYYAFLLPLDAYDEVGTPSNEFCFRLQSNMCVWDEACDTLGLVADPTNTTEETQPEIQPEAQPEVQENTEEHGSATGENFMDTDEHGAACVGMDLANVSHTISNNTITLRWTSLGDGSTVNVAIFDPDEEIYKPLGGVKMDKEKFTYEMKWNGEQNFSLTNGCKEVYYKVDANMKTPEESTPIVPAATGPAENILYIAIAAIVLYGVYTIFFRKSENN